VSIETSAIAQQRYIEDIYGQLRTFSKEGFATYIGFIASITRWPPHNEFTVGAVASS
jgi:hypothetical protein